MSTSSPFKPYITIDKTKPANTLKNEKKLATKCQDSMPSTLGTNCFVSETFSAAKVGAFAKNSILISENIFDFVNLKWMA